MRKKDVKTIKDLDEYYNKCRKIKLGKPGTLSITEIYNDLILERQPTFYVRGKLHCEEGRRRSIDDLIKVVKYYHPHLTIADICSEIKEIEHELTKEDLPIGYIDYCPDIRKDNYQGTALYENDYYECTLHNQGFPNCNLSIGEIINY